MTGSTMTVQATTLLSRLDGQIFFYDFFLALILTEKG